MKTIEEMIQKDIDYEMTMFDKALNELENRAAELRKEQGLRDDQMFMIPSNDKYYDIKDKYSYYFNMKALYGTVGAREKIKKILENIMIYYKLRLKRKLAKLKGLRIILKNMNGMLW